MTSPFLSALCRQIYYLSMMHTWKLMDRSPQNCALVSNSRIRDYNSKDGTQFCAFHVPFVLPGRKCLYHLAAQCYESSLLIVKALIASAC